MRDPGPVLDPPFGEDGGRGPAHGTDALPRARADDQVGHAALVLEGHEDEARGRLRPLPAEDESADGCARPAPLAFGALGPWASASTLANSLLAEAMTNAHTFAIIATNHAGDDLYRFEAPGRTRGEYYLRQVLSSVNFRTGGDLNDFLHGFLNYQIEHHLFPDLPPRQYQRLAPKVRAVCEKHGVPYVQQSVFARLRQLVGVMVGTRSMRRPSAVS